VFITDDLFDTVYRVMNMQAGDICVEMVLIFEVGIVDTASNDTTLSISDILAHDVHIHTYHSRFIP
jgi:hypothetical protein